MIKEKFEKKYPFVSVDKYGVAYYVLKSKSIKTGKIYIGYYKSRSYAASKKNRFQEQILLGFDCLHNEIYRRYFNAK